ncbi:glycosyltransferase [Flavobacterium sp.]|uniref:glycosyltransferase n=1 Tax=Flavobacterium sp. TaxID=239 RepID=UPI00120A0AD5|nr:glycosyltransferase [Flavobacterium sp.]RZJ69422.1 MAG: glycosyltransferase family 4 protein [Flavobacterium sp.]
MRSLKICLVGNSLSFGGADKIHAVLSNYLASEGFEVHNIIFIDAISYDFSGEILNLGKTYKTGGVFEVLKRFRMISKYLKKHEFDYIIDFRSHHKPLREFVLTRLMSRYRYIPTVHSFNTEWYFTPNDFVAKRIFSKAHKIVCVASEIESKVKSEYGYQNVMTIPNPLEIAKIQKLSSEEIGQDSRYILAAGRMAEDDHKQFAKLIDAFADSDLPKNNFKLLILGDGPLRKQLETSCGKRNLPVIFKGFVQNPYPYLKTADFVVLTSKFEGLPNILAEALAVGTPVVSFDCKSGPRELIAHKQNGLLVPNQNWDEFVKSLNLISENNELRHYCASNAEASIRKFEVSSIGQIWKELLK